jgi:hypothetical protein
MKGETRRTAESLILTGPETAGRVWLIDHLKRRTGTNPELPKIEKGAQNAPPERDQPARNASEKAPGIAQDGRTPPVPPTAPPAMFTKPDVFRGQGGPSRFDPATDPELRPDDHFARARNVIREPGENG